MFPASSFWEQTLLYARQFCPPHKASKSVGLIKRAVQSGAELPLVSGIALERELQQQLFEQLGVQESQVKPEAKLADDLGLGTDSLDTVGLVMALEEEFLDSETKNVQTVQDVIQYIKDCTRT